MTTALRRRLSALQNLTVDRGATPGEAAAAREAERRIRDQLKATGTVLEWPDETEPSPGYQQHPGPSKRRAGAGGARQLPRGRSGIGCTWAISLTAPIMKARGDTASAVAAYFKYHQAAPAWLSRCWFAQDAGDHGN